MLLAIPVYNEKKTILSLLEQTLNHLPDQIQKVVCIDDGSTDGSSEVLDEAVKSDPRLEVVHQKVNGGYGNSIITGLREARKRNFSHLITMDCDLQHRPEDLIRFVTAPPEIDVVSGSRYMAESGSSGHAPQDRMEVNRRITARLNRRYQWQLTDSFCGFKRFGLKRIEETLFTEKGYAFPLEFWAYAKTRNLSIQEIPVSRIYVTDDRSFGEDLDKKRVRYRYYLETLSRAEKRFNWKPK